MDTIVTLYDLHDAKMLYILTQNSLYNRKNHPYILCKCKKNEASLDRHGMHECVIISDVESITLYNTSEEHYNKTISTIQNYSDADHKDWADIYNYGRTHFGVHHERLPFSTLRFDILHMICQITRKLLDSLRNYLRRHDFDETLSMCNNVFSTTWSENTVLIFAAQKPFSMYDGKEIYHFIDIIPGVTEHIKNRYMETRFNKCLIAALKEWKEIATFIRKCQIFKASDNEHEIDIKQTI